jgi:hypothetical protein
MKLGVPVQIVRMLYYINTSAVKLPRRVRLNEFEHMMKAMLHKGTPDEVINAPRPLSYMNRVRGLPQGAPTSPFLASIALIKPIMNRKGLNCIQYADDGLYYGKLHGNSYLEQRDDGIIYCNPNQIPIITPNSAMVESNIHFNLDKSG